MTKKRVWISKYALSGEITAHDADIKDGWAYPGKPFISFVGFKLGRDAHETPEAAIAAAKKARTEKIASLKKQIAKLEFKVFVAPD